MTDIDQTKDVYLFIHGQKDLEEKSINLLVENGFPKEKIILAKKEEAGKIGDYVAMLWMPPTPDHIKIQKISKVEPTDDSGMMGVWKGATMDTLFEIKL